MRIALGISYHGSRYCGWQKQLHQISVQTLLEQAISKVADHPVNTVAAGRTDKGVHAVEQVVHFDTHAQRSDRSWLLGINTYLPADIRVLWVMPVNDSFHARYKATSRSYRYIIYNAEVASAIYHLQTTWCHQTLDESLMAQAAHDLIGEHDFTSYRALGCQARSPIRHIYKLEIQRRNKLVWIDITANGFLHHMVRNIAGVLMAIGMGKQNPVWAKEILEARDRAVGGITAPANGLYFVAANYADYIFPRVAAENFHIY